MRGKGIQSHNDPVNSGITPAYAGKSSQETVSSILTRDHPRLCGEKKTIGIKGR